jgi:hypothetical protein
MKNHQLGREQQQGQQQRNASNSGDTSTKSTASKEGTPTITAGTISRDTCNNMRSHISRNTSHNWETAAAAETAGTATTGTSAPAGTQQQQ